MIQWIDRAKANGDNLDNCRSRLGGEMLPLRSVIYYRKHLNTILFIWPSFSRGHQNSNSNDSLLLLFDGLRKVKADYVV